MRGKSENERKRQNYETKIQRRDHLERTIHCHTLFHDEGTIDFRDGGHCTKCLAFDDPETDLERVNELPGNPLASNCTDIRRQNALSPNSLTISVISLFK